MTAVTSLTEEQVVPFVLEYELSCGANATTASSTKVYPYPERLFGSIPAVSSIPALKRIYKHLAMRLHPDKNTHPNASQAFQVLQCCFEATLALLENGKPAAGAQGQKPTTAPQAHPQTTTGASQEKDTGSSQWATSGTSSHSSRHSHATQQRQSQKKHDDFDDPDWDNWTEKKPSKNNNNNSSKSAGTSASFPPPPQPDMSSGTSFPLPSATNTKKKLSSSSPPDAEEFEWGDIPDAAEREYWWDEDAQKYYYYDEDICDYAYYEEESEKKNRKAEKKSNKANSIGKDSMPGMDLSSDDETEAAIRKLEKKIAKRRKAALNNSAKRKISTKRNNSDDEINGGFPEKLDIDIDTTDDERDNGNSGDSDETQALVRQKEQYERKLTKSRRKKVTAHAQAEADADKVKTKKSSKSLAQLFQQFGISDDEDRDLGGTSLNNKNSIKEPSSRKKDRNGDTLSPLGTSHTISKADAPPATVETTNICLTSSTAGVTTVKPKKLTPAQALAEKRRTNGTSANGCGLTGTMKFQVTCPHCHQCTLSISMDSTDKAVMCKQCCKYFVPSQLIASTAVGEGSACGGTKTKIIRVGIGGQRCPCGRAKAGSCFMCE